MNNQNMIDTVTRISGVNPRKCMRCGKCSASCPAYDEMEYHPHQFVSMVENGRIEELLSSKGIYTCLSCFACVERCPRNVEPAKLIEAVRLAVTDAFRRFRHDARRCGLNRTQGEEKTEKGQESHFDSISQHLAISSSRRVATG